MTGRKRLLTMAAVLLLACAVLSMFAAARPAGTVLYPEQYALPEDLGVTFQNAEEVVQAVREALTRCDSRITVRFRADGEYMQDFSALANSLLDAAMAHTGDPCQGDYLRYQYDSCTLSYSHEPTGDGGYLYTLTIVPEYYMTAQQAEEADEAARDILRQLHIDRMNSDEDKVRAIYEWMRENVEYDRIHKKNPYYHLKSTAWSALVRHTAACQGYCTAMYRLLLQAGVDCRIITGTAVYEDGQTEAHSWLLVRLDDVYYNLDVTWDDQEDSEEYYLKTDADFPNHVRDEKFLTAAFCAAYPTADEISKP